MLKSRIARLVAVLTGTIVLGLGWAAPAQADLPSWPGTRVDCDSGLTGPMTCVGWVNGKAVVVCIAGQMCVPV